MKTNNPDMIKYMILLCYNPDLELLTQYAITSPSWRISNDKQSASLQERRPGHYYNAVFGENIIKYDDDDNPNPSRRCQWKAVAKVSSTFHGGVLGIIDKFNRKDYGKRFSKKKHEYYVIKQDGTLLIKESKQNYISNRRFIDKFYQSNKKEEKVENIENKMVIILDIEKNKLYFKVNDGRTRSKTINSNKKGYRIFFGLFAPGDKVTITDFRWL